MLIAVLEKKSIVSFIIIFGTLSFPVVATAKVRRILRDSSFSVVHTILPLHTAGGMVAWASAHSGKWGQLTPPEKLMKN